ncbi:MAG: hypothetical protein CMD22_07435 [Flavobacteriales bacterium]|nr:hypothetical protein [Flavobacteriales bacterium]|tara:strand:+ start:7003 stop:8019 length:1017 start_codon:yes stop_codon:yes gene_type:complete
MNRKNIFNTIKVILSFGFMTFILYYFFGENSDSLQRDLLKEVDYLYVLLSMLFGGWAYVNRGFRWLILIDALSFKTSKINSVSAVSVGYFTNLFIPRAGEISRCTVLNKSDNIPVDKLFGTILIERVIDFIALIAFFFLAVLLKSAEIAQSINEYQKIGSAEPSNTKLIILFVMVILIFLVYVLKNKIKQLSFYQKVIDFIDGLKEGFKSIKKIKNKSSFWFHTFSIWIMYFLMTYICFHAIPETSHLGVSDGLFLLVLGGIGMVIPAPGGMGSYHLIVMIGLVALQIPEGVLSIKPYDEYNPAMLFPFVVHTAQTFVAIIMGSIGFLMLFRGKKKTT